MLAAGYCWQDKARAGAGKEAMARGKALIDSVMADLKELREFKLDLVDTNGSLIADMSDTSYRVLSNTKDYTPTFNVDDPLDWRQDTDRLTDIANERD